MRLIYFMALSVLCNTVQIGSSVKYHSSDRYAYPSDINITGQFLLNYTKYNITSIWTTKDFFHCCKIRFSVYILDNTQHYNQDHPVLKYRHPDIQNSKNNYLYSCFSSCCSLKTTNPSSGCTSACTTSSTSWPATLALHWHLHCIRWVLVEPLE
jgi:hypothetical protein